MKRIPFATFALSALLLSAACSSDPGAQGSQASSSTTVDAPGVEAGTSTEAGAAAPLDAACDAAFDAMKARVARCGPESVMNLVPVEHARPSFKKLCQVQGSRPGTGYTAAFRMTCAQALMTAACSDDDAVVKACWEPRGQLARGLPCNADDQCQDGLCELPSGASSGTSCGVCGTPVWKQEGERCDKSDKDKCEAATVCGTGDTRSCFTVIHHGAQLGAACEYQACLLGLSCRSSDHVCVKGAPLAAVGEKCFDRDQNTSVDCELGAVCKYDSGLCIQVPGVGEAAISLSPECDSWTTKSATGKCIVKEALSCN